jgi:hypothetical protein
LQEQYATVFEALLEALTVPDTAIDKDHFCNYLEDQQLNITPKNQTFHKNDMNSYDVNSKIFGKVRTFINQAKRF